MQLKEVEPYAAHCTFQISANMGKRNRMREAMIFEDEPDYYTGTPLRQGMELPWYGAVHGLPITLITHQVTPISWLISCECPTWGWRSSQS